MGMVVDIVAGKNNRVYKSNYEKMLDFTKVADDVIVNLDDADYKNIKKMIAMTKKDTGRKHRLPLQHFGAGAMKELLVSIGILFADMPEKEFERMLVARRLR